jgi:hypothetical protein
MAASLEDVNRVDMRTVIRINDGDTANDGPSEVIETVVEEQIHQWHLVFILPLWTGTNTAVVLMGDGNTAVVTSHGIIVERLKMNGILLSMLTMVARSLMICEICFFLILVANVICFARMTTFH